MDAIDRRTALRSLMGGAVTIGLATSVLPGMAEATPLAMQKDPGKDAGDFKQEAQAEVRPPPGRLSIDHLPIDDLPITGIAVDVAVGSAGGIAAVARCGWRWK